MKQKTTKLAEKTETKSETQTDVRHERPYRVSPRIALTGARTSAETNKPDVSETALYANFAVCKHFKSKLKCIHADTPIGGCKQTQVEAETRT